MIILLLEKRSEKFAAIERVHGPFIGKCRSRTVVQALKHGRHPKSGFPCDEP